MFARMYDECQAAGEAKYISVSIIFTEEKVQLKVNNNTQEAIELVEKLQPSIVLMDIQMPLLNGIEATRIIK